MALPRTFPKGLREIRYPSEDIIHRYTSKDYTGEISLNNETGLFVFNPGLEGLDSSEGVSFTVTQIGHGFSVLQPIYHDGSQYIVSNATNDDTLGYWIITKIINDDKFTAAQSGRFTSEAHGLIPGQFYFVDTTDGALTITEPTTFSNPILYVETVDVFHVLPYRASTYTADQEWLDDKLKISATDTTNNYLDLKVVVSGGLTKSTLNPSENEILNIDDGIIPVDTLADLDALISGSVVGKWIIRADITLDATKVLPLGVTLIEHGGKFILGNFNITGDDTKIECGLNQLFDYTGTGIINGTWNLEEVYPQWFGALGNDVDDGDALQATQNFLNGIGGGKLFYPPGIYAVNSQTITIYGNIHHIGVYGQSIIKQKSIASDVYRNLDGPVTNLKFDNLIFEGATPALGTVSTRVPLRIYGYDADYNRNIEIVNCVFKSDYRAIIIMKGWNIKVHENLFEPMRAGLSTLFVTQGGITPLPSEYVEVHDNTFKAFGVGETDDSNYPQLSQAAPIGIEANNVQIHNNFIEGWTYNGITAELTNAQNVRINNNTIKATLGYGTIGQGIFVRIHKDVFITNNKIIGKDSSDNGISVTLNSSDTPILTTVYDNIQIANNIISNTSIGIFIFQDTTWVGTAYDLGNVTIKGNNILNVTSYPIFGTTVGFDNTNLNLSISDNIGIGIVAASILTIGSGASVSFVNNDSIALYLIGPSDSELTIGGNTGSNFDAINLGTFDNFLGKLNDQQSETIYGPEFTLSDPLFTSVSGNLHADSTYIFMGYGYIYTEATDGNTGVTTRIKRINTAGTLTTIAGLTSELSKGIYTKTEADHTTINSQIIISAVPDISGIAFVYDGGKTGTGKIKPFVKFIKIR